MSQHFVTWPCRRCDAPGIKNLGADGYCAEHLSELYARFDPAMFTLHGIAVQSGPLRPDYGPGYVDVACAACGATWTGLIGESCWWCERSHQITLAWQAEIVLRPPDVDINDARRPAAMRGWAERLARAVKAGIVDERVARRVLKMQVAA